MKMICMECGGKDNYEYKVVEQKHIGEGYDFTMEVRLPICKECGAAIISEALQDEITKKANERIRKMRGIIGREEIMEIVSKYDASQKFLSRMLGWGEITLTRYINNNYTPSASNSEKLKSIADPYVLKHIVDARVEEEEDLLDNKSLEKLQKSIRQQIEKVEQQEGKIFQVVNWFLSNATDENSITHLALQKLLYFSQCWNRILNNEWLFEDDCEAWVHGAVYHNVYNKFKKFRYKPLPMIDTQIRLTEAEIKVLLFVKKYYFDVYTAKTLEKICHLEEPFQSARVDCDENDRSTVIIEKQVMFDYYEKISKKYNISDEHDDNVKLYLNDLLA